jgi:predicted permease
MFMFQAYTFVLEMSASEFASRRSAAIIALVLALLIAWMWVAGMKSKLKSVRKEDMAHKYIAEGSMNVRVQKDRFLYKNVVATPRPKQNKSD